MKKGLFTEWSRNKRIQLIEPELNKNWRILDLGCGEMWLTNYLKSKNYNCIGVDLNNGNVLGDCYKLPFKDKSFDCILAIEIFEHVKPKVYKEIKRVCKNKLIVQSPKKGTDLIWKISEKLGLIQRGALDTPHINYFNLEGLPFRLVKKKNLIFVEQHGVFEV